MLWVLYGWVDGWVGGWDVQCWEEATMGKMRCPKPFINPLIQIHSPITPRSQ